MSNAIKIRKKNDFQPRALNPVKDSVRFQLFKSRGKTLTGQAKQYHQEDGSSHCDHVGGSGGESVSSKRDSAQS